jgi:hypothetical protein
MIRSTIPARAMTCCGNVSSDLISLAARKRSASSTHAIKTVLSDGLDSHRFIELRPGKYLSRCNVRFRFHGFPYFYSDLMMVLHLERGNPHQAPVLAHGFRRSRPKDRMQESPHPLPAVFVTPTTLLPNRLRQKVRPGAAIVRELLSQYSSQS